MRRALETGLELVAVFIAAALILPAFFGLYFKVLWRSWLFGWGLL